MDIGKKVRELRKKHNMTANELAELCNISQSVISKLENGKRIADVPTLSKICEVFNITLADFFESNNHNNSINNNLDPLDDDLQKLFRSVKKLNSKQIKSLTDFLKIITETNEKM